MTTVVPPPELVEDLNDLFTRCYVSAATYAFEAQPHQVAEDAPVLALIGEIRDEDRSHAILLANLLRMYDLVPEPGVFPYWHRDVNYLTVPYMANFVAESLAEDLRRIDAAIAAADDELRVLHATLRTIRTERAARLERLRPMADEALAREQRQYVEAIHAIKSVREDRLAKEKAAAEAAREAAKKAREAAKAKAAPVPEGMLDPNEPGISAKERAKRTMMIKRAQKKAQEEGRD